MSSVEMLGSRIRICRGKNRASAFSGGAFNLKATFMIAAVVAPLFPTLSFGVASKQGGGGSCARTTEWPIAVDSVWCIFSVLLRFKLLVSSCVIWSSLGVPSNNRSELLFFASCGSSSSDESDVA